MKAIFVMFDSLNRHALPPYGGDWVHAPNFQRLAPFGTLLFDLAADPDQLAPMDDAEAEARMVRLMTELMLANDAPAEQYRRLGLPAGRGEPSGQARSTYRCGT